MGQADVDEGSNVGPGTAGLNRPGLPGNPRGRGPPRVRWRPRARLSVRRDRPRRLRPGGGLPDRGHPATGHSAL